MSQLVRYKKMDRTKLNIRESIKLVVKRSGDKAHTLKIEAHPKGKNNRCYKITTANNIFLLKQYFTHKYDNRNRFQSEKSFIDYANTVASSFVPKIRAVDESRRLILFEYIPGEIVSSASLNRNDIKQAINFFKQLNQSKHDIKHVNLPLASEACFSIKHHISLISERIKQLSNLPKLSQIDEQRDEVVSLIEEEWRLIVNRIPAIDLIEDEELDSKHRCISPSDFGFHNALKICDDEIKFVDFEYAGWDDPAKMVADFFCQLEVPVPIKYYDDFVSQVMSCFTNSNMLKQRANLLLALYKIKWCCIVLNVFLATDFNRRQFAMRTVNEIALKRNQIEKVRLILNEITSYI